MASICRCRRGRPACPSAADRRLPDDAPASAALDALRAAYNRALDDVGAEALAALARLAGSASRACSTPEYSYTVRGREVRGANYTESLSHSPIPKLAAPRFDGLGRNPAISCRTKICRAAIPTPAGVYPYRREEEDPTRMFAGEGAPERTNRRFHYLAAGHEATRLSTAFDSTTLVRRGSRTCGPTSSAAPAIPACRSRRSTT